jgi:hypothetical protein
MTIQRFESISTVGSADVRSGKLALRLRVSKTAPVTAIMTLALLFTFGSASSPAQPVARAACTHDVPATIGGRHECLGAGEYCATRYERQYERYGFVCSTRYDPPRLRRR